MKLILSVIFTVLMANFATSADFINTSNKRVYKSVNTPDYSGRPNMLRIKFSELPKCSKMYWKISDGKVAEMSAVERYIIDVAVSKKEQENKTKADIENKITAEIRNSAIQSLKKTGKIPQDYK